MTMYFKAAQSPPGIRTRNSGIPQVGNSEERMGNLSNKQYISSLYRFGNSAVPVGRMYEECQEEGTDLN